MLDNWKAFLLNAGAEFEDGAVQHFGNLRRELSVALTGNVFADLSHYGLISVHGNDAASFLQAQLSNDLNQVTEHTSQLGGYCNPKGRLIATMRIFRRGDSYYLCLPHPLVETVINRLRMFVLRAQVTLEDATETFVHIGVSGSEIESELSTVIRDLPDRIDAVTQTDETVKICVPGIHPSFEIYTTTDNAKVLWDALNVRGAAIGADAWRLLDIEAGIPIIRPETSEAFVPQMVNLQLVNGVSFKKGCYPGQEIVARMQYLGKLKRRMYKLYTDSSQRPLPGDDILVTGEDQPAGQVVDAAPHPDGGFALLAVLRIQAAEAAATAFKLAGASDATIRIESLPYPFPAPEQG